MVSQTAILLVSMSIPYRTCLTFAIPVRKQSVASNSGTPTTPTALTGKQEVRTAEGDGAKGSTGDTTRDKCAELLYNGLACDSSARRCRYTKYIV